MIDIPSLLPWIVMMMVFGTITYNLARDHYRKNRLRKGVLRLNRISKKTSISTGSKDAGSKKTGYVANLNMLSGETNEEN